MSGYKEAIELLQRGLNLFGPDSELVIKQGSVEFHAQDTEEEGGYIKTFNGDDVSHELSATEERFFEEYCPRCHRVH